MRARRTLNRIGLGARNEQPRLNTYSKLSATVLTINIYHAQTAPARINHGHCKQVLPACLPAPKLSLLWSAGRAFRVQSSDPPAMEIYNFCPTNRSSETPIFTKPVEKCYGHRFLNRYRLSCTRGTARFILKDLFANILYVDTNVSFSIKYYKKVSRK